MVKRTAIVLMLAACAAAFGEDNPNQKCVESLGEAQADVTNVGLAPEGSRNFVNYCLAATRSASCAGTAWRRTCG